ncbi:hypothetical protein M747DRAFT_138038 [Aspergillus niger ATCC 13496]|uniref:Uncharacterized protein n=1 Tax=Aspergillus niger ATCC 13496 TaxID=1353008 RepID=A0A370CD18_ASPNG|nr:hypothetical protein M747DRAFT_138038 [Aspergillus niger ATCC 13496]
MLLFHPCRYTQIQYVCTLYVCMYVCMAAAWTGCEADLGICFALLSFFFRFNLFPLVDGLQAKDGLGLLLLLLLLLLQLLLLLSLAWLGLIRLVVVGEAQQQQQRCNCVGRFDCLVGWGCCWFL